MNSIMPMTHHVMVSTPHYLASMVGARILQQGGNAFDAAVAISATLGVVYPHMTGIGGDSFFLLYKASERAVLGLNGSGRAGIGAASNLFMDKGFSAIPQRGPLSAVTVPGMVDAWWEVWRNHGRLPWEKLFDSAIDYAGNGFPISPSLYYWMCRDEVLIGSQQAVADIYMPKGILLKPGERLVQSQLAETLVFIQEKGRDAFYEGSIMKRMVDGLRDAGGILREEDFIGHRSDWVEPLAVNYRGYDLYQMPPNSQGFSALIMMNMLENYELWKIPRISADYYHLMVEVIKRAFRERDAYLTDSNFMKIPLEKLLTKSYARELCASIDLYGRAAKEFQSKAMGQDTAYAAVVDEEGNAVSFIQSLYFDFGSAFIAGDTGVLLQNRGSFFSLDPQHPNCLQPGKRTFHTLMPAMVCVDKQPYLLYGTQGGEGQPQTQLSILTGVLDYGATIQEAIALPRWVYGRTWGDVSDSLRIEDRIPGGIVRDLQQRGHDVQLVKAWDGIMGQAQGILINRDNGVISGTADPRGDGMSMGW